MADDDAVARELRHLRAEVERLHSSVHVLSKQNTARNQRHGWLKHVVSDLETNPHTQYKVHFYGVIYWLINFPAVCALFFFEQTLWLKLGIFITLMYSIYANFATDYGGMSAAMAAYGDDATLPPIPLSQRHPDAELDVQRPAGSLANALSGISGLSVSATYIPLVNPPAAVIMPAAGSIVTWEALGDVVNYYFRIAVLVPYTEDLSAQTALDALLDESSAGSIMAALRANITLGGLASWAVPTSATTYGLIEWAGVQYFGTNIMVTVAAL